MKNIVFTTIDITTHAKCEIICKNNIFEEQNIRNREQNDQEYMRKV
jgi:hypothetical protein